MSRKKLLESISRWSAERTMSFLLILILITTAAGFMASKLKLSMQFSNLLPQDMPIASEFNKIIDQFSSASNIIIVAEGEEKQLKKFADALEPKLREFKKPIDLSRCSPEMRKGLVKDDGSPDPEPWLRSVDTKLDTKFLGEHSLQLMKYSSLVNMEDIFTNPNIGGFIENLDDSFEREYIETDGDETSKSKENDTVWFLNSVDTWLKSLEDVVYGTGSVDSLASEAVKAMIEGEPYYMSPDKDFLLVLAQPSFDVLDMSKLVAVVDSLEEVVHKEAEAENVKAGLTGMVALSRDEMTAVTGDMMLSTVGSLLVVFILLVISFRMFAAPILAVITISIGVVWAMALSYLAVGSLNMMTSMMAVILVGLGIDFSIHIITVYTEEKEAGLSPKDAMREGLTNAGPGIITGGLTTAFAFLTMMISKSAGMYELGAVLGLGMIATMVSAITVMPVLLLLREKILVRLKGKQKVSEGKDISFKTMGRLGSFVHGKWRFTLLAMVVVTILMGYSASNVQFDYNYLNMEPVGLESIRLQDRLIDELDMSTDFSLVAAESVEESRDLAERARKLSTTGMVESISDYIPDPEELSRKKPIFNRILKKLETMERRDSLGPEDLENIGKGLERLEMNIEELADLAFTGGQDKVDRKAGFLLAGNRRNDDSTGKSRIGTLAASIENASDNPLLMTRLNAFSSAYYDQFSNYVKKMISAESPTIENLPKDILDKFANDDRTSFLVTIYPDGNVWELKYLKRLSAELASLSPRVTGMPPLFNVIIELIKKDGIKATILALVVIFILLLLDFRSFRFAAAAMMPLVSGALWMVGIMAFVDLKFTIVNVMVIPMILGIGVDDGVHLLHRYRAEGRGSIDAVMRSTGKAILLTSLTTMLAFGSLKYATYRGLGSAGMALFIGVGACFITSVFVIPAITGLMERK